MSASAARVLPIALTLIISTVAIPGANSASVRAETANRSTTKPQSGPSVELPESKFDFGEVFSGQVISHTFKVKNVGGQPLTLNLKHASTPSGADTQKAAVSFSLRRHSTYQAVPVRYSYHSPALTLAAAAPI